MWWLWWRSSASLAKVVAKGHRALPGLWVGREGEALRRPREPEGEVFLANMVLVKEEPARESIERLLVGDRSTLFVRNCGSGAGCTSTGRGCGCGCGCSGSSASCSR